MKLYNYASGALLKTESNTDGTTSMTYNVAAGTEYQLLLDAPWNQANYGVSIDLPTPYIKTLSVDSAGDAMECYVTLGSNTASKYYKYTASGSGAITVEADDADNNLGFDTDLFVYNGSKQELFRDTGSYDDGNWNSNVSAGDVLYFLVRQDISDEDIGHFNLLVNGPGQPDLTPYQPSGWSDKVVVSNNAGDHTDDSPIFSDQTST